MLVCRPFLALSAAIILYLSGAHFAMAGANLPSSAESDTGTVLTLGKVTTAPGQARRMLEPLAAHVARYLEALGIKGIRLQFARSNDEMLAHLRAGRVDWITETASAASAFVDAQDAEILARRWRRNAPEYQTIIVARRDSNILNIRNLAGKTIAFETPESVSRYFIPAHALLQAGLALHQIYSSKEPILNGAVGYTFSKNKRETSALVREGKVDAGAFSNRDWRSEKIFPPAHRASFRIIYTSAKYPYALELVRSTLRPAIKSRLRAALLEAHKTPSGRAALHAYNRSARFDDAPAKVTRSIAELRNIRKSVRSHLR